MNPVRQLAPSTIRVFLIGGHTVGRTGLRLLLEVHPDLRVIGEAPIHLDKPIPSFDGPDVILVDLDQGIGGGLDSLHRLMMNAKQARVLILTHLCDPETHLGALRLGAMGLVLKEQPAEVLAEAIRKVHTGQIWFDPSLIAGLITEVIRKPETLARDSEATRIATLTEREREVVSLIGEGLKNKELARRLFISETTVRHHLTSIFDKLGVSDRLELVIYAYRHGLAKPPR